MKTICKNKKVDIFFKLISLSIVETCGFHLKEDGEGNTEDYMSRNIEEEEGEEEEFEEEQSNQHHLIPRKKPNNPR